MTIPKKISDVVDEFCAYGGDFNDAWGFYLLSEEKAFERLPLITHIVGEILSFWTPHVVGTTDPSTIPKGHIHN